MAVGGRGTGKTLHLWLRDGRPDSVVDALLGGGSGR